MAPVSLTENGDLVMALRSLLGVDPLVLKNHKEQAMILQSFGIC